MSEAQVLGLLRNTLDAEQRNAVERHLDGCPECLELVTLASQTSLVTRPAVDIGEVVWPARDATELAAGTVVGRYEIVEPLGRGGMGTVYVARDGQLDRKVAIKLVSPSFAHHAHSQIGLLREAQAMARITHANVLTVYDMGMFDDAVFLAAELVDGETLEAWLARPRGWRQIVELFVQAARGLEAAHAAGLVHRDFKPSNVLVGRDGRVRVFDFGVVRFVDTVAPGRELAGTPMYMSPEQQEGEPVDARSDQYSLCVALHEALFGARPAQAGRSSAPRIAERDGGAIDRPPSWLRELVQRGLAHAPARRFPAMRDLIAAIERGLGRRRRSILAGVAGLAIAAAVVTAVLGYTRGKHEQVAGCRDTALDRTWGLARQVEVMTAVLATGAPYAPATMARVARGLDQFAARWKDEQRGVCLAFEIDETEDRALHDRRRACLDRQRLVFEAIVDQLRAADRTTVRQADQVLGALPGADSCARPDDVAWPSNPAHRVRLTRHLQEAARLASLATAGQAIEADRGVAALVAEAATLGSRRTEADAMYLDGRISALAGRSAEGARKLEQALWAAQAAGHDELVVTAACELIHLLTSTQRRTADARSFVALARASAERVGSVTARATAARVIGELEIQSGRYDAAETELRRALALTESQAAPDPMFLAFLQRDLSNVEHHRAHFVAAEPPLRQALALMAQAVGAQHPMYAQTLANLANLMADLRRYAEATAMSVEVVAIMERALGPVHPDLARVVSNSASVHGEAGALPEARALFQRGIAMYEVLDPESPNMATVLHGFGELTRVQGDLAASERAFARAAALYARLLGPHHPETSMALTDLYWLAAERGDLPVAAHRLEDVDRALAGAEEDAPRVRAEVETCRGDLERRRGHAANAVVILERALALQGEPTLARARTQLALVLALPERDRVRATALARAARAEFAHSPVFSAREIAELDRWLAAHRQ